jgi:hypothetical protein
MAGKYIKCPRCELNYIKEDQEYCDVCKAELKKGPQLLFAIDDEEEQEEAMDLCPKCHQHYLKEGERYCQSCLKAMEIEETKAEDENDESWKEFLDDEAEEEEESEEMLSLSKLVEEEGDELFDDEEEEEIELHQNDEPDDFNYDVDESDFEDTEEEEEESEEDDEDDF